MEPDGCLTRDPRKLVGLEELLPWWRAWRRMPSGKRGELSAGRDAERYLQGSPSLLPWGTARRGQASCCPTFSGLGYLLQSTVIS